MAASLAQELDPASEARLEEKINPKISGLLGTTQNFAPMLGHATWHPNKPDKEKSGGNTISAPHGTTIFVASL